MKRIFLDTNFILDYLIRDEFREISSQFLAQCKRRNCRFYISFLTVANFAYIMRKLPKDQLYAQLKTLTGLFEIVDNTADILKDALDLGWDDFEDAVQYLSALSVKSSCIITRNQKDFTASAIPVLSCSEYTDLYINN